VSDLVQSFDIGFERTRVGVVVYSDLPQMAISLGDYADKQSLLAGVGNITYLQGEFCCFRKPLENVLSSFEQKTAAWFLAICK